SPQPQKSSVQDILGLFDSSPSPALSAPAPSSTTSAFATFSPQPQSQAPPQPSPQQQHPPAPRLTSYTAYDKQELKITLTPQTSAARPGVVNIMARFQVSGSNAATGLNFQAAVPKSQQLQMLPMSNSDVQPGTTETQQMRVMAPPGSNIRLRLRISYTLAGQAVQDQIDFSGFPPGLTGSG
ncbi:Coatomer/clathrin adaptor appendage, Ig-like subdomain-containing protein, partial [Suillus subalutaceus]|uniref:Coatomer/clathrin adaptor appendage, Ig-like subdomain-containing protein n=1 Tax=Suillus subalutaceus TaxID=48586 RepID=UPI001B87076F